MKGDAAASANKAAAAITTSSSSSSAALLDVTISIVLFVGTALCFSYWLQQPRKQQRSKSSSEHETPTDQDDGHNLLHEHEVRRRQLLDFYITRRMSDRLSYHGDNDDDDTDEEEDEDHPLEATASVSAPNSHPPSVVGLSSADEQQQQQDANSTTTATGLWGDVRSSGEEAALYTHNNWKHFEGYHHRDSDCYSVRHRKQKKQQKQQQQQQRQQVISRSRASSFGSDAHNLDKMLEGDDRHDTEDDDDDSDDDDDDDDTDMSSFDTGDSDLMKECNGIIQQQHHRHHLIRSVVARRPSSSSSGKQQQQPSSAISSSISTLPTVISQTVMTTQDLIDTELLVPLNDTVTTTTTTTKNSMISMVVGAAAATTPDDGVSPIAAATTTNNAPPLLHRTASSEEATLKKQQRQSPSLLKQLSSTFMPVSSPPPPPSSQPSQSPPPPQDSQELRQTHSNPELQAMAAAMDTRQTNRVARKVYNANIMPDNIFLIRHGQSLGNTDEKLYSTTPDNSMPLTKLGWQQARAAGVQLQRIILERNHHESSLDHHEDVGGQQRSPQPPSPTTRRKRGIHFILSPYVRTVETFHGMVSAWCDPAEFAHIPNRQERLRAWYGRLLELGLTWHEDPRIREQDFGNYQEPDKIQQAKRDRYRFGAFYYRFPHGESASDVFDRVSTFLDSLWRSFDTNDTKYYVLVTHGISIRVILARYFRYTIDQFHLLANPRNCEMVVLGHDGSGRLELEGRYELEFEHDDVECKENGRGASDDYCRIAGYKFHRRLRVLPEKAVRTVRIRMCYDE